MKCSFCGTENENSYIYCVSCGMKLVQAPTSPAQTVVPKVEYDFWSTTTDDNIKPKTNSHIYGIMAVVISIILMAIVYVAQIASTVLAIIGIVKGIKDKSPQNNNNCVLGIILSIIALLINIGFIFLIVWLAKKIDDYDPFRSSGTVDVALNFIKSFK